MSFRSTPSLFVIVTVNWIESEGHIGLDPTIEILSIDMSSWENNVPENKKIEKSKK